MILCVHLRGVDARLFNLGCSTLANVIPLSVLKIVYNYTEYFKMDDQVLTTIDELLQQLKHVEKMDQLKALKSLEVEKLQLLHEIEVHCPALNNADSF